MNSDSRKTHTSLLQQAGVKVSLEADLASESVWIDVIQKMDAVYADLVRHQVELEQKNAELEQTQQFVASVLSAMTDVLVVCDTRSIILEVNAALEQLTGYSSASIIGKPLDRLFGASSTIMAEAFTRYSGNHALIDCEMSVRCSDGSSTPLAMNCSPRYDGRGRLAGAVIIGRPVGELRRAYEELNHAHRRLQETQQQLVQSEKMASLCRLVAGVAHELNNPISFMVGNIHALKRYGTRLASYLEEVEKQIQDPHLQQLRKELRIDHILEDMRPLIDGTMEGAERVSDIVQDLGRYSGAQSKPPEEFDLVLAVKRAVEWVTKAGRIKPRVEYHMPDSLPYLGQRGHFHQVLVNLVQNAMDAMSEVGEAVLEISVSQEEQSISIRVADQGPGIPPEDLARIFDPFYTSKPVGQGTGLGLYVSYGLAQELGGSLEAGNRSRGGAVFTLRIPLNGVDDGG